MTPVNYAYNFEDVVSSSSEESVTTPSESSAETGWSSESDNTSSTETSSSTETTTEESNTDSAEWNNETSWEWENTEWWNTTEESNTENNTQENTQEENNTENAEWWDITETTENSWEGSSAETGWSNESDNSSSTETRTEEENTEIDMEYYTSETRIFVLAQKLWINWTNDAIIYAQLAWIDSDKYTWTAEQNGIIREYLLDHIESILNGEINQEIENLNQNNEALDNNTDNSWEDGTETEDQPKWESFNNILNGWWSSSDSNIDETQVEEEPVEERSEIEMIWDELNAEEINWNDWYNDIVVNVSAPIETFPKGTELRITPIEDEDKVNELKDKVITQYNNVLEDNDFVFFDISFVYTLSNWEEIKLQPLAWQVVDIVFDYKYNDNLLELSNIEWNELKVYYINNDEVKEATVNEEDTQEWELSVYGEWISEYIIVAQKLKKV